MNYNFSCDHKLAIENLVNFGSRSESKWKMGSRWKRFGTATLFATNKMSAALTPWNKNQTEGKAKVVAAGWGTELIKILCHTSHLAPGWFVKKRLNRRTDTLRNGYFGENGWSSGSHHTKHHPPKLDVLPKTFLQIIRYMASAAFYVWPPKKLIMLSLSLVKGSVEYEGGDPVDVEEVPYPVRHIRAHVHTWDQAYFC